jgi:hypothetical protein
MINYQKKLCKAVKMEKNRVKLNSGCTTSKVVVIGAGSATMTLGATQNVNASTDKSLTFELSLAGDELAGVRPMYNYKNRVTVMDGDTELAKLEVSIVPIQPQNDGDPITYKLRSTPLRVVNQQKSYTLVWRFVGKNPVAKMYETTESYTFQPVPNNQN